MSEALKRRAPAEAVELSEARRRERALEAVELTRDRIAARDYRAVARDARERFPKVLDALAK